MMKVKVRKISAEIFTILLVALFIVLISTFHYCKCLNSDKVIGNTNYRSHVFEERALFIECKCCCSCEYNSFDVNENKIMSQDHDKSKHEAAVSSLQLKNPLKTFSTLNIKQYLLDKMLYPHSLRLEISSLLI